MEMMKRNVGSREVEQVDSNKDNLVIKEENEEKAYQKIKDELGIEPVRIIDRPDGFKYKWTKLEKRAQISEIMYQYKEKVNGVNISIHEYKVSKSKEKRYVAKFKYLGVRYYLTGVMPKKDFNNILKKLYFS